MPTTTEIVYASEADVLKLLESEESRVTLFLHWKCWQEYMVERLVQSSDAELERMLAGPTSAFAVPLLLQWLKRSELAGWLYRGRATLFDACMGVHMRPLPSKERQIISAETTAKFIAQLMDGDFERSVEVMFVD